MELKPQTNPYGEAKAMSERILIDTAQANSGFAVCLLRYFNPVGAHESGIIGEDPNGIPNNLMPLVSKVARGLLPKLSVFGNDYDTPDGTGKGTSVLELLNSFANVNQVEVPYEIVARRPGDIAISYADASKAEKELGWKAQLTLEDMVKDAWNFERKQRLDN